MKWLLAILFVLGLVAGDYYLEKKNEAQESANRFLLKKESFSDLRVELPQEGLALDFEKRIFNASPKLVTEIQRLAGSSGKEKVTASLITVVEEELLKSVLQLLPEFFKEKVRSSFLGVVVAKHIGSSALVLTQKAAGSGEPQFVIVLDQNVFQLNANEWATKKENSIFRSMELIRQHFEVRLNSPQVSPQQTHLLFLVLHEMAHFLQILEPKVFAQFSLLSWSSASSTQSLYEEQFPRRGLLRFYQNTLLLSKESLCQELLKTNFPTLYSAVSPAEDFAESVASFLLKSQFQGTIETKEFIDGQQVCLNVGCWGEERCQAKESFLKQWLKVR